MLRKDSLFAAASLIGTIIGAGIFGIPYLFARAGILICALYFLVVGSVILLVHLVFTEVVIVTEERHRLVGFVKKYLGKKSEVLAGVSLFIGGTGVLLAYLILAGDFLTTILPFSVEPWFLVLIFWAVLSVFVLMGLKTIAPVEFFLNLGFILVIALIFLFSAPLIKTTNLHLTTFHLPDFHYSYLFLPFGVILFSMIGWDAIPGLEDILRTKENFRKVVIASVLSCLLFYFVFGLIISGVAGESTGEQAFQGLDRFLGQKILILGNIFGLLAVSSSFLVIANYIKNTLYYDYRLPKALSFLLAVVPALILFLLGLRCFISVINIVGALFGMVEGALIILVYRRIEHLKACKIKLGLRFPYYLLYSALAVLVLGGFIDIGYNIVSYVR